MRATIQLMTSWAIKGVGVASRVSALALSLAVLLAQMPLLFAAETNTSKTLTIGTEHYPPLSNVNEKGFEDLIAKEMYRRIGINIVLKFLPSERVLFNVNKGLDDGMLSRVGGMNALYPNLVQFEESLFTADYVAFARRTDIQISGWDSLRPYNVGIINGWKILEKNIKGTRSLTKVKNSKQLFSLLDGGRADVIVFSRFSGLQIARDRGLKDIKPLEPPLASRKRFFYLHKKNKVLVPQASAALRDMKADGFYQRIFDNTIGPLITD